MKPITYFLQKNISFTWDKSTQETFEELIKILTSDPCFNILTFLKPYYNINASKYAIESVLQQHFNNNKLFPIAFASRTVNKTELNYSTTEKETLAIV